MQRLLFLLMVLVLVPAPAQADGLPKARQGTFALTNARIVTVTSGIIEGGTLVIRNDRIAAIGTDVDIPSEARVIDVSGLSVYPGMIDAGTRLGLVEVGSLPETRDFAEIGSLTPQMRALTAVNPNSVAIPVTRVSGVTTVIVEPSGGLLPGTAALINLHGYTAGHLHAGFEGVVLEFPVTGRRGRFDRRTDEEIRKQAQEAMDHLDELWDRAVLYHRIDSAFTADPQQGHRPEYVPEMDALLPVIRSQQLLIMKVDRAQDITAAIDWLERRGINNAVLSGVSEGWRVADRIAAANLPVLVGPVLSVPTRASDRYDKPYANAGLLRAAGVTVALRTGETENVRNLPFHAGFAAAYGLGKEEALRSVTIVPAQIFGVDGDLGSLEVGKKATLFVADGDPFETRTSITHLFIDGYDIPLVNRQTRLYEEFRQREPGLEKHDVD